jgi:hypothetical protein
MHIINYIHIHVIYLEELNLFEVDLCYGLDLKSFPQADVLKAWSPRRLWPHSGLIHLCIHNLIGYWEVVETLGSEAMYLKSVFCPLLLPVCYEVNKFVLPHIPKWPSTEASETISQNQPFILCFSQVFCHRQRANTILTSYTSSREVMCVPASLGTSVCSFYVSHLTCAQKCGWKDNCVSCIAIKITGC